MTNVDLPWMPKLRKNTIEQKEEEQKMEKNEKKRN
jgi:hypothetical protein